MLDIRADHYVSPLSEVAFASVKLTVTLHNYADETGIVQGKFRVYNDETGHLIHTSDIAPVTLSAGQTLDVSALTNFDPPAPADDTYFVMFEGHASNALVPRGIDFFLGSFYFDVKPAPLGPIPAGHHVTHEATGIDEINVNGLSGVLADRQTPILHHLDHELGGSDEVNVTGLLGVLSDKQPPQTHGNAAHTSAFEDQANKGAAGGYCGLPDPLDSTQPLRADGSPNFPDGLLLDTDCLMYPTTFYSQDWRISTFGSGMTISAPGGETNHPGILLFKSSTTGSGYIVATQLTAFLISGNERFDAWFKPYTTTDTVINAGLCDQFTSLPPTNAVMLQVSTVLGTPLTLQGLTYAAGASSTTPTSYALTALTWYHAAITINADATIVTFTLYAENGTKLWQDTLSTNIPTAAGQQTGAGYRTASGTNSYSSYLDRIRVWIARTITR
jgi:hypothetical protein